jgi:hypothetical protein
MNWGARPVSGRLPRSGLGRACDFQTRSASCGVIGCGHRGVNFIRPPKGSRSYTIVLHFDTIAHLASPIVDTLRSNPWLASSSQAHRPDLA